MNVGIVPSPSKPESADDHDWGSDHSALKTVLGRRVPSPFLDKGPVSPGLVDSNGATKNHSDPDTDECKAALCNSEVANHTEDDRHRLEH